MQSHWRVSGVFWNAAPSGRLTLDRVFGTSAGDESTSPKIDLEDEAFLRDREISMGLELQVFFIEYHEEELEGWIGGIQASYWRGTWEGSGTLSAPLDLGTTVIPVGSSVESTLDLQTYSLDFIGAWEPPEAQDLRLEVWIGLSLVYVDLEMEVPGGTLLDHIGSGPFDAGARGRWDFSPPFFAKMEFQVTMGFELLVFDAAISAGTEWHGFPLEVSYRSLWANVDNPTQQTSFSFDGLMIGMNFTS